MGCAFFGRLNYAFNHHACSQVTTNQFHAGDYLTLQQVQEVREELKQLPSVVCDNEEDQQYLDTFSDQMTELVNCALEIQKPIAF